DIALLDVTNLFDLTLGVPGLIQDLEEARITVWAMRNTVKIFDDVGPLSTGFLDTYVVPGVVDTTVPTDPITAGVSPFNPDVPDPQNQVLALGGPAVGKLLHLDLVSHQPAMSWANTRWGVRLQTLLLREYTLQGWFYRTFNQAPVPLLSTPAGLEGARAGHHPRAAPRVGCRRVGELVQPGGERHHPDRGGGLHRRARLHPGEEPEPARAGAGREEPRREPGHRHDSEDRLPPLGDRVRPLLLLPPAQPVELLRPRDRLARAVEPPRAARHGLPLPGRAEAGEAGDRDRTDPGDPGLRQARSQRQVPDHLSDDQPEELRGPVQVRQPVPADRAPDRLPARQARAARRGDPRRDRYLRLQPLGGLPPDGQRPPERELRRHRGLAARRLGHLPGPRHPPAQGPGAAQLRPRLRAGADTAWPLRLDTPQRRPVLCFGERGATQREG